MAASKEIYCGQCEYDNVTTPGTSWCTDCSEGYCSECLRSHKAAKPSRNHHVIPISDYIQAERFSVSITCPTHQKKLDFFCRDHESILCVICVQQNHGKCDDLLNLNEASQGVKTSTVLADLEQNIEGILENIEKGVHSLQENRADIKKQEKTAILDIQKIRDQINKRLDSLQEKITDTLKKTCDECDNEHSTLITSLTKEKENLHCLKDNTNEMKKVASDFQAFIWIRNMINKVRETSEEVKPLINNIQEFGIVYQSNEEATLLAEYGDSFGQVNVTSKRKASQYTEQNVTQAQDRKVLERGIDNLRLRLRQRFKLDANDLDVTCCLFLPNKKMLFVNKKNNNLIILNEDGSYHGNIHVPYCVFDATVIDSERVAISYNRSGKKISIVNTASRQLEKSFPNCFKKWTWGISYYNEKLYFIAYMEGIKEMDLNGKVLRTINVEDLKHVYHATIYLDRVYYSGSRSVTCAELSGNVIWSYKDDKIKRNDYSQDLSICSNSAVLVTGESENIVMAISKDGKDKKILLNHSDGLDRPAAIHIDKNSLLICNRVDGRAFLYEIIY